MPRGAGGWLWDPYPLGDQSPPEPGELLVYAWPGAAEIYVDGLFETTADELRRAGGVLPISAGVHRVEVRASGYEPSSQIVDVASGAAVTIKAELLAAAGNAPRTFVPVGPLRRKTMYVIPGCFAGDKDPRVTGAAAACDLSRLKVIPAAP